MPDLDETVVHRSAGGSIHDSKVHEKLYTPIMIAVMMRTERPCASRATHGCDSLMS